ncbi:MAG TPA: GNAT family N-acetyltransferase [Candidatus Binatia bacterium]|nr:GNAT family N-acetyltransferase [Candidatus Binatia bacterium]
MTERPWRSRDAVPADVDGILALRRVVFGDLDPARLRPEIWRWQFVDNPAGAGYVRLAEHDGRIVGQYAAIPTRFRVDDAVRLFAMSCDTMTHPDYQKQGMFVTLARELYADLAARHGVTTVWGFPNDRSYPGFVGKLDWFEVHVFPMRVKPIRSRDVLQRYLGRGPISQLLGAIADRSYRLVTPPVREPRRATIRPITTFDERFDALWERHRSMTRVIQVRDRAYLDWRYCAAPIFEYRPFEIVVNGVLEGYFVLRVLSLFDLPVGAVVDLFPCPIVDAGVTREVLSFAQLRATEAGAAFLTALLPPAHAAHLTRFGFLRVPDRLNPRRWYFGARSAREDIPLLRDIAHWYVTYGDADIV